MKRHALACLSSALILVCALMSGCRSCGGTAPPGSCDQPGGCGGEIGFVTQLVTAASQVVDKVTLQPTAGYVVDPRPTVHKSLRLSFVQPALRSSLNKNGFAFTPPIQFDWHFDDNPADRSVQGYALSVTLDFSDADLAPDTQYVFLADQPSVTMLGSVEAPPLNLVYPFKTSAAGPDGNTPYVTRLSPGPRRMTPGWNTPITTENLLTAMRRNLPGSAPSQPEYVAPHAKFEVEFSRPIAQLSYALTPADPELRFGSGLPDLSILHPAPATKFTSSSMAGLAPGTRFVLDFLGGNQTSDKPMGSSTQDTSGNAVGPHMTPLNQLGPNIGPSPWFGFLTACVTIRDPIPGAWIIPRALGGQLPVTVFVPDNVACSDVTRINFDLLFEGDPSDQLTIEGLTLTIPAATEPGWTIVPNVAVGAQTGRLITRVVSLQPVAATNDIAAILKAEVFASDNTTRGHDQIDVKYDSVGPTLSGPGTFIADDDFEDNGRIDRFCIETDEAISRVEVTINTRTTTLFPDPRQSWVDSVGHYHYCWDTRNGLIFDGAAGDTNGYVATIIAYDTNGNPSAPGSANTTLQVSCSVPEKFVSRWGSRAAMAVDNQNVVHVVYTTADDNGFDTEVRYKRWSPGNTQWFPRAWDGEIVACLYGWNEAGDGCQHQAGTPRTWGFNIDIAIAGDGQPAVCFVEGRRLNEGDESEYTQNSHGNVWVMQRSDAAIRRDSERWRALYTAPARYFNCALVSGVPIDRGATSPLVSLGLGVLYTTVIGNGYTHAQPAFSLAPRPGVPTPTTLPPGPDPPVTMPTPQPFDSVDPDSMGIDAALAVSSDGVVRAAYAGTVTQAGYVAGIRYAERDARSGTWSAPRVVDAFGRLPSLAVDPSGRTHMSYTSIQYNPWTSSGDSTLRYVHQREAGTGNWDPNPSLQVDLLGVGYEAADLRLGGFGTYAALTGIPSRIVLKHDPTSGNTVPEIVFLSRRRFVPTPVNQPNQYVDIGQLLLARLGTGSQFTVTTLESRVAGRNNASSAALGATVNQSGRRRVLFYNGLADQLFYNQEENGNLLYATPIVDPQGPPRGCAARLGHRDRYYLLSGPGQFVDGQQINLEIGRTRPAFQDNSTLLREFRRYHFAQLADSGVDPAPAGWDWDAGAPTWGNVDEQVYASLLQPGAGYQMGTFLAGANSLLGDLNTATCDDGSSPCWQASLDHNNPPPRIADYARATPTTGATLIESSLMDIRVGTDRVPSKESRAVCVVDDADQCQLSPPERQPVAPVDPGQTVPASWVAVDTTLPIDEQAEGCEAVGQTTGADARLVISRDGGTVTPSGDGCYFCAAGANSILYLGLPGFPSEPRCGAALASGPNDPNVAYGQGRPYLVCRSDEHGGCDVRGAVLRECVQPTTGMPLDERFEPANASPNTPACARCTSGTTAATCTTASQHGSFVVCRNNTWRAIKRCTGSDDECDTAGGFECTVLTSPYGKKHGICIRPECTTDADCADGRSCVDGLCYKDCSWDNDCRPDRGLCHRFDNEDLGMGIGVCLLTDSVQVEPRPLCIPHGCQQCVGNQYCIDCQMWDETNAEVSAQACALLNPCLAFGSCTLCPRGHTCQAQEPASQPVLAPLCFARPFFDDYRVRAGLQTLGPALQTLTADMQSMVGAIRLPNFIRYAGSDWGISVDESVRTGGFRFAQGAFVQGYLEFLLIMDGPFDIAVNNFCDVHTNEPVVFRIRMQPHFQARWIPEAPFYRPSLRWTVTDAYIVGNLNGSVRPSVSSGCSQLTDQARGQLENAESLFIGETSGAIERQVNSLWQLLTEDMVVGGWLFGREAAIAPLDLAEDHVPIGGSNPRDEGDGDPADTVEGVLLRGPVDPASSTGGSGVLMYRER